MKGVGVAFLVLAALNFIIGIAAFNDGADKAAGMKMMGAGLLFVLGLSFISLAKKKRKEKLDDLDENKD